MFYKRQQRKISTYGKHARVKLIRILNYEASYIQYEEYEKYDAEVFL